MQDPRLELWEGHKDKQASGVSQTPGEDKVSIHRRKLYVSMWWLLPELNGPEGT